MHYKTSVPRYTVISLLLKAECRPSHYNREVQVRHYTRVRDMAMFPYLSISAVLCRPARDGWMDGWMDKQAYCGFCCDLPVLRPVRFCCHPFCLSICPGIYLSAVSAGGLWNMRGSMMDANPGNGTRKRKRNRCPLIWNKL